MPDYGLVDDTLKSVASSLQKAAEDIGKWLASTFESMTSVHVATCVSDNLAEVTVSRRRERVMLYER